MKEIIGGLANCHIAWWGRKYLFASKPCVTPIFCVIVPSIYQLTNKLM
jgi:hypothetical protein